MQKKIIKRVLIIIILFMIITWAYKIMKTYALFYSEGEGRISQRNATWTIYLNGTNVSRRKQ
ncbi:MAG: hypothetical protein ACI4VE_06020 [Clostridia bacterium]